MTDPEEPPRPRLYRVRDESVWSLIRRRYLSGETQKALALAYDVPICTIQKRITREGWSKRAAIGIRPTFGGMAAPRDFELTAAEGRWPDAHGGAAARFGANGDDEAEEKTPEEVAARATTAAGRALAAGRVGEAEKLGRLAATMKRLAPAAPAKGAEEDGEDEEDGFSPDASGPLHAHCTDRTCQLDLIRKRVLDRMVEMDGWCHADVMMDVQAWGSMAKGVGARLEDEDLRFAVEVMTAEAPSDIDIDKARRFCAELCG